MNLSNRISQIKPSPTLAVDAKAKAMKAQGVDLVSFGAGEPDFDTPENIKEAAIKAIRDGFTRYTAAGGTDELKDAVIDKFRKDNGLEYTRGEVVVNCGGKHSFYNLAQVLFDQGDEVIIPAPFWVSYPPMTILAGAKPVIVETTQEQNFKITPEQLRENVTPATKALVINSPSNPTGSVYTRAELEAIAQVAVENDFFLISDDIYEKILFDGATFHTMASIGKEVKERSLVLNGVSKSYSMTGWRIGYMAGPKEIIGAVTKIQSQSTSNPNSIAQKAAVEALTGPQDFIDMLREAFQERKDYIIRRLNQMPGIRCFDPKGAFYAFPNVSEYYGRTISGKKIEDSNSMADFLLDVAKVAVVPGIGFGADPYIRLSFATSMEQIREGLDRMERALTSD